MRIPVTGSVALGVVMVAAAGAAAFRVSTAPDRIRDRVELARKVCLERGGDWVTVDRSAVCRQHAADTGAPR